MSDVWAAVPVKALAEAKQRLSPRLTAAQRHALAAAMLEDVLTALCGASIAGIMVNTADNAAAVLAHRFGARVVTERAQDGHTAAVTAMAEIMTREGTTAMLTVPGDIPRIVPAEVRQICAEPHEPPFVAIVPAHDQRGSNAVLLVPPTAIPLRFGDDSFFPHLETARRHGIEPQILSLPGIALDIDHPDDLYALLHAAPRLDTRAGRLLEELRLSPR